MTKVTPMKIHLATDIAGDTALEVRVAGPEDIKLGPRPGHRIIEHTQAEEGILGIGTLGPQDRVPPEQAKDHSPYKEGRDKYPGTHLNYSTFCQ